jgi:hypothetical protein
MPEFSVFHQKFEKFRQNYLCINLSYFISYSSLSIKCVFDINQPKSSQNGSKKSLWPHILTQFDEIYRLVYDMTIYDQFLFLQFFTLRDLHVEKWPYFYLSVFGQITHQSIDLVKKIVNFAINLQRVKWKNIKSPQIRNLF